MADPYTLATSGYRRSAPITTHNTNPLPKPIDSIYFGSAGNLTCRLEGDTADCVLKNILAGTSANLRITHVRTTGTTVTDMVGFFFK